MSQNSWQLIFKSKNAVLRIRDIYLGSLIRIFPTQIPDPHQRVYVFLTQKVFVNSLKYDPGCSSRIRIPDLDYLPIRIQVSKRHRNTDTISARLKNSCLFIPRPPWKRQSALQNTKFPNFFFFLRFSFALLDPDPAERNQCGTGPTTLNLHDRYTVPVHDSLAYPAQADNSDSGSAQRGPAHPQRRPGGPRSILKP
jgi:hypothetical protein